MVGVDNNGIGHAYGVFNSKNDIAKTEQMVGQHIDFRG